MAEYKVYMDEKHHLGLVSEEGKHRTPAVYDEIQTKEDGVWYCRAYTNWDYFYPKSGTFSMKSRCHYMIREEIEVGYDPTTPADREVYDSISEYVTDRYIILYKDGKFGVKSLDGSVILETIYDDVILWYKANVIQVRKGDKHLYFNDRKERILTDVLAFEAGDKPFWDGIGNDQFVVREIVESATDNHTYESEAGMVRIYPLKVREVADLLETNCERIPMDSEVIKDLTDQYSYEFGMSIIKVKADADGVISDEVWEEGMEKLGMLHGFGNSWYYIDKFLTNSKTKLSVKSLYWLKHRYEMKYQVLNKSLSYGIDDTLADGEVKWIHVKHYNEHCFPEDYGVSDAMRNGTLGELKEIIETHDWQAQGDPYGGCFFGYRNICYFQGRPWRETERILNYMYELGHNPKSLIVCAIEHLYYGSLVDFCGIGVRELTFWKRCVMWALRRGDFPNSLSEGETRYDLFLKSKLYSGKTAQRIIKEIGDAFLAHGARTGEQQIEFGWQQVNAIPDPYDYSIADSLLNK